MMKIIVWISPEGLSNYYTHHSSSCQWHIFCQITYEIFSNNSLLMVILDLTYLNASIILTDDIIEVGFLLSSIQDRLYIILFKEMFNWHIQCFIYSWLTAAILTWPSDSTKSTRAFFLQNFHKQTAQF